MKYVRYITVCLILLKVVHTQRNVGDSCVTKSSGSRGVCKLLSDCPQVRNEVVTLHVLPQTCGFQGTQAIVCCPRIKIGPRSVGEISQEKCRQYSSYAYDESQSSDTAQITKNECGHNVLKRIVGGTVASRKEFPHMAIIGFASKNDIAVWSCGGTIISEQYILTTAICLRDAYLGNARYVRVGITNLNDTNHRQEINITERILHPAFKGPSAYNDIGLIKLEKPIILNSFARPACLYTRRTILVENAIATGWGSTSFAGSASEDLLKVTLDFVDQEFCNISYKSAGKKKLKNGILDQIQICAGTGSKGKDTCQGDTGGPLQIHHDGDDVMCMYDIVGLTSFGKACGIAPGVYTRVSYYIKWIEDIVWPEHPDQFLTWA